MAGEHELTGVPLVGYVDDPDRSPPVRGRVLAANYDEWSGLMLRTFIDIEVVILVIGFLLAIGYRAMLGENRYLRVAIRIHGQ